MKINLLYIKRIVFFAATNFLKAARNKHIRIDLIPMKKSPMKLRLAARWIWGFLVGTMNNIDLTCKLYRQLNENRLLSRFVLFQNLKYINTGGERNTDLNGGFLHRKKLIETATKLNITTNTLRQRLSDFKKLGWLTKTFKGYRLTSWRSITEEFTPELTKIKIYAKTKKELIEKFSFTVIERSLKKQVFKSLGYMPKGSLTKKAPAIQSEQYSLSCRTLAKKVGYKAAATGIKLEQRLKKLGQLKIIGRSEKVCKIEEYANFIKYFPELLGYCFVRGGFIHRRLCNNLIPLEDENLRKVKELFRIAAMRRKYSVL